MRKKNIAVIFGGNSTEYEVSLQSSFSVIGNLDKEKYHIILIGITREGDWYHYFGETEKIADDTWSEDTEHLSRAAVSVSRSQKGFLELDQDGYRFLSVDAVFPVLHGKNGEDGTLQGMFELAGIPVIGCGMLSSAICMDKEKAHRLVSLEGISIPKSITFSYAKIEYVLPEIKKTLKFPVFVKPVR